MGEGGLHPVQEFVSSQSSDDAVGRRPGRSPAEDWYDTSWNPTAGCSALSPGCEHCDALRAAIQLARMGGRTGANYAGLARSNATGPVWTGEIRVRDDLAAWPLHRSKPRRVLVDALSDLFHEHVATATIDRLHAVMAVAHWHLFLILTKRAERMAAYYRDPETAGRIALAAEALAAALVSDPEPREIRGRGAVARRLWAAGLSRIRPGVAGAPPTLDPWPLPNLWPGVSVEDGERMVRIRHLVDTRAAMRWVCFEPLLGPVRPEAVPVGDGYFDALNGDHYRVDGRGREIAVEGPAWPALDWVVVGGETGAAARPMRPDWVRAVRDRCIAAGIPLFFKQWGEWAPDPADKSGARMIRVGRRTAGRLLDGRSWNELPGSMSTG